MAMALAIMYEQGTFDSILKQGQGPPLPHTDYDRGTVLISPANPSPEAKKFIEDAERMQEDLNQYRQPEHRFKLRVIK
jgi:hypothetical protein